MPSFYRCIYILFFCAITFFFSILSCSPLEENRTELQTVLGFPLTVDQAKKLKQGYIELGYHDNILLRKTFKSNQIKNVYSEYFNSSSSKVDSIKKQIDFFSSKKTGNGTRIVSGTSSAIFTNVDTYSHYEIQKKEYYGKSIIRDELYVLVNGKALAFQEKSRLNRNDEFNSGSYGMNDDSAFFKFYYNTKGELILFCDYVSGKYHVCMPTVQDALIPLATFPLEDFDILKRSYFPLEDISYYKDNTLKPSAYFISNLQQRSEEQVQYRSEIGTKITKESLDVLSVYDQFTYTEKGFLRTIERYTDGKLLNTTYFTTKDESDKSLQEPYKALESYTIARTYEGRHGDLKVFNHYTKDTLAAKEVKIVDQQQRIIGYKKHKVGEKEDHSKNVKFYYDNERNITLIFHYKSNGMIDNIRYQKNGMIIYSGTVEVRKWWKSKLYLFPNEKMDFYRTGFL